MKDQGTGSKLGGRVSVKLWRNHPSYKYRASWVEGGKYKTKGFRVKKEAEAWAANKQLELVSSGADLPLTHDERATVNEYRDRIESIGMSLRELIQEGRDRHAQNNASVTVAVAVEEFTALKESMSLSDRAMNDIYSRLGRFANDMGDRIVSTITVKDLDEWMLGLKSNRNGDQLAPRTWRNYRTQLTMLFKQCHAWGYCGGNPVKLTQQPPRRESEIHVLTPEQAASLLANASDEMRPSIAIGLFAGCRVSEIQRLDWQEVNLDTDLIELQGAVTKKKFRRIISIRPNLKAWLLPYAQASGPISPGGARWRSQFDKVRAAAGFAIGPEGKGEPWGNNAMRHSFASYGIQAEQNPGRIAVEMGHRGSAQVLFDHYVTSRSPKQADAYWSIMPEQAGNVLVMGGSR